MLVLLTEEEKLKIPLLYTEHCKHTMLCIIVFLLSSFREFVYDGYKLSNSRRVGTTTVTATKMSL